MFCYVSLDRKVEIYHVRIVQSRITCTILSRYQFYLVSTFLHSKNNGVNEL